MHRLKPLDESYRLYSPLDVSKQQVRLLLIHSTPDEPPLSFSFTSWAIQCTLSTVSLTPHTEFNALSYAWGDQRGRRRIYVNGYLVYVTSNLFYALKTFRDNQVVPGFIWVDAICINQQDLPERSQQVQLMGQIFARASTVRGWLGQANESTKKTIALLEEIKKGAPAFKTGSSRNGPAGDSMQELVIADGAQAFRFLTETRGSVDGLTDTLDRSWWRRLWVVQEVLLSKMDSLIVHVGEYSIVMSDLLESLGVILGEVIARPRTRIELNSIFPSLLRIRDIFVRGEGGISIFRLLSDINYHSEASDSRDRVYGLLSLLPQAIGIVPDYSKSVEEVYESTAALVMQWCDSLILLEAGKVHELGTALPTWVPDWRSISFQVLLWTDYDASAGASVSFCHRTNGKLGVRTMILDSVSQCPEDLLDLSGVHDLAHWRWPRDMRMRNACRRWWTLASGSCTAPREIDSVKYVFWRTVRGGYHWTDDEIGVADRLHNQLISDKQYYDVGLEDCLRLSLPPAYSFCTTEGNYMCTSTRLSKIGDKLGVIAGCPRPVLLRPKDDRGPKVYQVVGTCYVDGIMHGEAVRQVAQKRFGDKNAVDGVFEDITLV